MKGNKKSLIVLGVLILILAVGYFLYEKYITSVNIPNTEVPDVSTGGGDALTSKLTVPDGFSIDIFAKGLKGPRVIELDPKGTILISEPSEGKIVALPNKDSDYKADSIVDVVTGLNVPHGMTFRCTDVANPTVCDFYVAEKTSLDVFKYDPDTMKATNKKKLLDLPGGSVGEHFTRTIMFLPSPDEDTLLISIGSSCNVCRESDSRRASIISYNILTGKSEPYAKGLRNSVFMTIHPVSGKVYATEMGRDNLGDNIPPDEINIIEKDKNYGWPICYGKNTHDDNFDKNTYIRNPCMEPYETPSYIDLQAHSAPLGLAFFPEEGWPESYWFNLLVAYHGSWNRSVPTGYKIVRIVMDAKGKYLRTEDFITGWLTSDGKKIGRPVDIKVMSGGTAYISDDLAGVIYKLSRK